MDLKKALIKLGEEEPELRQDLSAVLDALEEEKESCGKEAAGRNEEKKLRQLRGRMDDLTDEIDRGLKGLMAGQMRSLDSKSRDRIETARRAAETLSTISNTMANLLENIDKGVY